MSRTTTSHPLFLCKISKKGFLTPAIGKKFITTRRQKLNDVYFFDGSIYISDINYYLKKQTFNHNKTIPMIFPKYKSFELDDMIDFQIIDNFKNYEKIRNKSKGIKLLEKAKKIIPGGNQLLSKKYSYLVNGHLITKKLKAVKYGI